MISSSNSLSRGSGMPNQVDGALVHAMSGNELSRVRTESGSVLPSLSTNAYSSRGGRHCYAIKCPGPYPLRLNPARMSAWGKQDTNRPRKVLKSSPWAHYVISGKNRKRPVCAPFLPFLCAVHASGGLGIIANVAMRVRTASIADSYARLNSFNRLRPV
jgi:hypothetical protein